MAALNTVTLDPQWILAADIDAFFNPQVAKTLYIAGDTLVEPGLANPSDAYTSQ